MASLLAGFLFGVLVAAPVGPVAILCVRRTLGGGWRSGLASGLGVGTADAIYAAVGAAGVGTASLLLGPAGPWLQLAGGLALALIGLRTLLTRPAGPEAGATPGPGGLARDYGSILAITLANPPTIVSFAALSAALAPVRTGGLPALAALALGVFLGSTAWWTALTGAVAAARRRLSPGVVAWTARVSGGALLIVGVAAGAAGLNRR